MKKIHLFLLLTILLYSSGCSKESIVYSDNYIVGQDSQIGFKNSLGNGIAESTNGYYFCSGPSYSFLYFFDKQKKTTIPLCNKPNCLHADEPDSYRIAECNAYIGSCQGLKYYTDDLYYNTVESTQDAIYTCIYRISTDGSRRVISKCPDIIQDMQFHRGYAYYCTNDGGAASSDEDSIIIKYGLYRVNLDQVNAKSERIIEGSGAYAGIGDIICYGNGLYYEVHFEQDSKYISNLYRYDIRAGTAEKIIDDASSQFTIFNKKLVYLDGGRGAIASDLDGKNPLRICDAVGPLYSNSNYLFIDNLPYAVTQGKERTLTILNTSWQTVKSISLKGMPAMAYGCSDEYFFVPDVGKQNDIGEIVTLDCIPVDKTPDEMKLQPFYEFVPRVPLRGINTTD